MRILPLAVVTSLGTLLYPASSVVAGAPLTAFPGAFPSTLYTPAPRADGSTTTWPWPALENIRDRWQTTRETARTAGFLFGRAWTLRGERSVTWATRRWEQARKEGEEVSSRVAIVLRDGDSGTRMHVAWAESEGASVNGIEDCAPGQVTQLDERRVLVEGRGCVVAVDADEVSLSSPVSDDAWNRWLFADVLMDDGGPVHAPEPGERPSRADATTAFKRAAEAGDEPALMAALAQLVALHPSSADMAWMPVMRRARKLDSTAAMAVVFRHHQPMGQCSQDTFPAEWARMHADFCRKHQRLGCFLQLQVRIMGDQFDRMAWSNLTDGLMHTEAGHLADAGVAPRTFLSSLLVELRRARVGYLGPWRLARSVVDSGVAAPMSDDLGSWASDTRLDAYNRFRAAAVLLNLRTLTTRSGDAAARAAVEKALASARLSVTGAAFAAVVSKR